MPDSPINPQPPSIEPLADVRARAHDALIGPDFRPTDLPDPVLLELVALAYRARATDRLEGAAGELLRRLRYDDSVTAGSHRRPDHEVLEAHPAPLEGAVHGPEGDCTPAEPASDQAVPMDGSTREAVHDILMAALEQGLVVLQTPAQTAHAPLETQRNSSDRHHTD